MLWPHFGTDPHCLGNARLIFLYKFPIVEDMRRRDYLSQLELMVLLAILRTRENAYGMSIVREIERHSEREVALAGIYAALERLEAKGLVRSERGDPTPERGGKARTYFEVTGAGLKALRFAHATFSRLSAGLTELTPVTV
jgi:PadR family transcriptional regulator, regulatory protein PadR